MNIQNILLLLLWSGTLAFAEAPDWLEQLPYDEAFFYGVGRGSTEALARDRAVIDIKMQLSTKVSSVISIEEGGNDKRFKETIDFAVNSNTLSGAEMEDSYTENGYSWVLMKYCDACSNILMNSILTTIEDEYDLDKERIMEEYIRETSSKAVKLKRVLDDLELKEFNSRNMSVLRNPNNIVIRVSHFLPDSEELTNAQIEGIRMLSDVLLSRLTSFDYSHIMITGHANPTGKANEFMELETLSQMRAETMEQYLSLAGLNISEVKWKGGSEPIGDNQTEEGKALNRRVEIIIFFKNTL